MRGAMGGALVVVSATLLVLVAGCGGAGRGDEAQPVFEAYVAYLTAESGRATATGAPAAEREESGGLAEAPRPIRPAPACACPAVRRCPRICPRGRCPRRGRGSRW
jgi:hypothetical protein